MIPESLVEFEKKLIKIPFFYNIWCFVAEHTKSAVDVKKLKQDTVKDYANAFHVDYLVEIGTYKGEMIDAVWRSFNKVYSIELDTFLYERAVERFKIYPMISIFHGDSAKVLPNILPGIDKPTLFWLDAHYSGGITAKSKTPVFVELLRILHHKTKGHVILMDDADCFTGENDYPTVGEVIETVKSMKPTWVVIIKDNIIRIHKQKEGF